MMKEVMRVNGDNNSSLCANLTSWKKSGKLNVGITAIQNMGRQCAYAYGSTATENSCTVSSTPMHSTAGSYCMPYYAYNLSNTKCCIAA